MVPTELPRSCSILFLAACLAAQGNPPAGGTPPPASSAPATSAPAAQAPAKGDELRKAFVDADGGRRTSIAAAADKVLAADKAGRTQFMTTLRAIGAAAPAPAATPAATPNGATPAPATTQPGTTPAPSPAPAKPVEFADDVKKTMAEAIGADAKAQSTALAKLAADKDAGPSALTQLDERGKLILARCVSTFIRKRLETNAIFAGQYTELRDFHPESSDLLLKWAKEAPREIANPEQFRTACLRALRDTLTSEQATDRVRAELREILGKAQGKNRDQMFGAACALMQYGDSAAFDALKGAMKKQSESGSAEEKQMALGNLAELHYQARKYEEAAGYYTTAIAVLEMATPPPPGLPTIVYNAACCLALAGKTAESLQLLEKALEIGAKSEQPLTKALIDSDHDIESLRKEPKFVELYEKYFGKGGRSK